MFDRLSFISRVVLPGALLLALAGCGGGSGDPAAVPTADTRLIAGAVEDGPIAGASVSLYTASSYFSDPQPVPLFACGASGNGRCSQVFDNPDGHFAFLLTAEVDPATLLVEAAGGIDQSTRFDFSRTGIAVTPLRLLSSLDWYADQVDQISVNPLTTLLVLTDAMSPTPAAARQQLLTALGATEGMPLFDSPGQHPDTQRLALLLSKLAILVGSESPFADIADYINAGNSLVEQSGDVNQLTQTGLLTADQLDELMVLYAVLSGVDDPAAMSGLLQRHELVQGFKTVLLDPARSVLPDPGLLNPVDQNLTANLETLAGRILTAVGDQLLLGGKVPEHLARNVLFNYGLEDVVILTAPADVFEDYLTRIDNGAPVALEADASLADLANLQVTQPIQVPLSKSELFTGDDLALSDLKRDYYYNSDISHLYRAKQLIWNLSDDRVSDAVLVQVVEGEALAGRFAEVETLIRTQIYQSEARGQAYLKYAEGLSAHGFSAAALKALSAAEALFRKVVDAKGVASFSRDDAVNFEDLADGYVQDGFPAEALNILQYLATNVAGYITVTTSYGNLTTAGLYVVDAFADLGDMANAETALDLTCQLALGLPNDSNGTARYRVRVLVEVAERSAELGYYDQVWDAWNEIETLRYANGQITATGTATEVYMSDLVVAIYAAGGIEEAFSLMASLPVGSGVLERYQMDAVKKLATYIAVERDQALGPDLQVLQGKPEDYTAMDLINFFLVPDYFNQTVADSQIEALTYYNSVVAYVAQAMIDRQLIPEATDALEKAEQIVVDLDPNGVKLRANAKVNYGYAKLAELYLQFGDVENASRLLTAGVAILPLIDDQTNHAKAVALLAELYLDLGDFTTASNLLALIDATVDLDGYPRVIEAYLKAGNYPTALVFVADFADAAEAFYNPETMDNSADGSTSARNLARAAGYYSQLGYFPEAVATLQRALPAARDIPVQTTQMDRLIQIAEGFAASRAYQEAENLAWSLPFVSDRNEALLAIARVLATRDDFPESAIATIDLDGDGRPDFFNADATADDILQSGLTLDRDSDNDGVDDTRDRWPFYAMLPSQPD